MSFSHMHANWTSSLVGLTVLDGHRSPIGNTGGNGGEGGGGEGGGGDGEGGGGDGEGGRGGGGLGEGGGGEGEGGGGLGGRWCLHTDDRVSGCATIWV